MVIGLRLVAIIVLGIQLATAAGRSEESGMSMDGIMIKIAHRGASGYCPENTLAAFSKAAELAAGMVELDVHMSSDGQVMVIHDETVDRTTSDSGAVASMTAAQLQKLDAGAGEKIPTLEEVLVLLGGRCGVNVELKGDGTAAPVAELLRSFVNAGKIAPAKIVVSSFDHEQLAELKEIAPEIRRAPLFGKELPGDFFETVHALGAWSVNLSKASVTAELVERCHGEGVRVLVYTVNDPDEIAHLKELGVDGIIGDYPDRL